MPLISNPFTGDAFSLAQLTNAINKTPNQYGRLNDLRIFRPEPLDTRMFLIEEAEGSLNLVLTKPVGGTPTSNKRDSRKIRQFRVPYMPLVDSITAEDLMNKRGYGTQLLMSQAELLNRVMTSMRAKFEQTFEYLRWGALNGEVIDADGTTVLCDIYSEFGVTQVDADFKFSVSGTDIAEACRNLIRSIEDNLKGEMMSGVQAFVSPEFYDALIKHGSVSKYYINYAGAQAAIADTSPIRRFAFNGVVFEEHRGRASFYNSSDDTSTTRLFVPTNGGLAFPMGTRDVFSEYYCRGTYLDVVGQAAQMLYVKQYMTEDARRIIVDMESNYLPLVKRPELIVKLTMS